MNFPTMQGVNLTKSKEGMLSKGFRTLMKGMRDSKEGEREPETQLKSSSRPIGYRVYSKEGM